MIIVNIMKGKKINKWILLLLISIISFTFSGCWSRHELNSLNIVGMVGIDKSNDIFDLTFEIYRSQHSGVEQKSVEKYIQSKGKSILDAIRNTTLKHDRKLLFSHVNAYVFSEEIAKKGIGESIDFWMRDHECREGAYVLIAKDTSPSKICSADLGMENCVADFLRDLIKAQKANSKAVSINVLDFLKVYNSELPYPVVGIVHKSKNAITNRDELIDEGAAVFNRDKLIGFLNGYETRGYNWVTGKIKSGVITSDAQNGKSMSSVEIIKSNSKNDVNIEGNMVKIQIKVTILGVLDEKEANLNFNQQEKENLLAEESSKIIKGEIENIIEKAQHEYNADIFGFGEIVHEKYPDKWEVIKKKWNELYTNADVNITVKTNIKGTGLLN